MKFRKLKVELASNASYVVKTVRYRLFKYSSCFPKELPFVIVYTVRIPELQLKTSPTIVLTEIVCDQPQICPFLNNLRRLRTKRLMF